MSSFIEPDLYFDTFQEFKENLRTYRYISAGSEGSCYQFSKKYMLKYYDKSLQVLDSKDALKFKDVKSNTFHFNLGSLYIAREFSGITREYVPGKPIIKAIRSVSFDTLIEACKKLEEESKNISYQGIEFVDIDYGNMLWNKTKFEMIDTDRYKYDDLSRTPESLYKVNISTIPQHLIFVLFLKRYTQLVKEYKILKSVAFAKKKYTELGDIVAVELKSKVQITPTELLEQIKYEIQSLFGDDINCIEDTATILRKKN